MCFNWCSIYIQLKHDSHLGSLYRHHGVQTVDRPLLVTCERWRMPSLSIGLLLLVMTRKTPKLSAWKKAMMHGWKAFSEARLWLGVERNSTKLLTDDGQLWADVCFWGCLPYNFCKQDRWAKLGKNVICFACWQLCIDIPFGFFRALTFLKTMDVCRSPAALECEPLRKISKEGNGIAWQLNPF